jgi:hypothetical protein
MGVHYDAARRRYVVRWNSDGRRQVRRFQHESEAIAFAETVVQPLGRPPSTGNDLERARLGERTREVDARHHRDGDGIHPYETAAGVRWRFNFRQSDRTLSTRRGFATRAAAAAAKRRLLEDIRRGDVKVSQRDLRGLLESRASGEAAVHDGRLPLGLRDARAKATHPVLRPGPALLDRRGQSPRVA